MPGTINGRAVRFVVDTGATNVAMSEAVARSIGLDFAKGERGFVNTANGQVVAHRVSLREVRVERGPGSYVGLRVAVTFARTFAAFGGAALHASESRPHRSHETSKAAGIWVPAAWGARPTPNNPCSSQPFRPPWTQGPDSWSRPVPTGSRSPAARLQHCWFMRSIRLEPS